MSPLPTGSRSLRNHAGSQPGQGGSATRMSSWAPFPFTTKASAKVLRAPEHSPLSPLEPEPTEKLTRIRARAQGGQGGMVGILGPRGTAGNTELHSVRVLDRKCRTRCPQASWLPLQLEGLAGPGLSASGRGLPRPMACGNITPFRIRVL